MPHQIADRIGITQEDARAPGPHGWVVDGMEDVILSVSPKRWKELASEVRAILSSPANG